MPIHERGPVYEKSDECGAGGTPERAAVYNRNAAEFDLMAPMTQCETSMDGIITITALTKPALLGRIARIQQQGVDVAGLNGVHFHYAGRIYTFAVEQNGVVRINEVGCVVAQ